ncbi:Gfo/Idh/MocA family oxidoreductase [uncultured Rikenella sp.]|uniref:Gfo/Idh/MocA family oxidoreductase n=1 Tax=uncultured Rikenella sp. TaxID=368003 RepID=UPI0026069EB7|nr:Gfo/Idh/MocA family oxidoreductase [uncultured Rikenella sp.]
MYSIAIIGAGQLGSRHLQGLKLAQMPMCIQVIDKSPESLLTARERYEQIVPNPQVTSVEYLTTIDELAPELDLVIVATGSKPRAAILAELLSKKQVRNLLLEKILFPDLSDYTTVGALLHQKGLIERTWVNCPRRMFVGYRQLREELRSVTRVSYEKRGPDWGLGCNAIHFIDLFSFLTGDTEIKPLDLSGLDSIIQESKRAGYVEFTGTIQGETTRGNAFKIISSIDKDETEALIIVADGVRYEIDEPRDSIRKDGRLWGTVGLKYQSQLTGSVAEQILLRDECELTPYEESAKLHLAFLKPLVTFYNELTGKNGDNCPIT